MIDLRDGEFEERVARAREPVLVEFWAPWCGPCRKAAPVIGEVVEELKDRLRFLKVDTDENTSLPQECGVSSIPTLILFDRGREIARFEGRQSVEQLKEGIVAALTD